MKTIAPVVFLGALAAALAGCSSSTHTTPVKPGTLTSGNWLVLPRSNGNLSSGDGYLRGLATISGGNIEMNLQMTASGDQTGMCVPQGSPVTFTGTVSGAVIKIGWTGKISGKDETGSIAASIDTDSSILGTYASSGLCADSGSLWGTYVPPISGAWSGTVTGVDLVSNKSDQVTVSGSLTQAGAPSSSNSGPQEALPLSGTVTVSSAACTGSSPVQLTLDPTSSYITGDLVAIVALSADQQTQLSWFAALTDPTTAIAMKYSNFHGTNSTLTSSTCNVDFTSAASLSKD